MKNNATFLKKDAVSTGINRHLIKCKKSVLTIAIAIGCMNMSTPLMAAYNVNGDPIGDLEIYKAASKAGANVMMMVDSSGSMGVNYYTYPWAEVVDDEYYIPALVNGYQYFIKKKFKGSDSIELDTGVSCITTRRRGDKKPHFKVSDELGLKISVNPIPVAEDDNGLVNNLKSSVELEDGEKIDFELTGCSSGDWETSPKSIPKYGYTRDNRGTIIFTQLGTYNDTENAVWIATGSLFDWVDADLSRMSKMKNALIQSLGVYTAEDVANGVKDENDEVVVAGQYRIKSTNLVGLGTYGSAQLQIKGGILVPSKELTLEHRKNLINTIAGLESASATPIARAYTETAAYMKGLALKNKNSSLSSITDTEIANSRGYVKPGADKEYECYGKGIYFLTDGFPNYATEIDTFVSEITGTTDISNGLSTIGANDESNASGWDGIGSLAKYLRNYNNPLQDIKTATVGFGKSFADLSAVAKKSITNSNGKPISIDDCDKADQTDVKNLCKWGEMESHTEVNGEYVVLPADKKYGAGGFTYARNGTDISNSVIDFIGSSESNLSSAPTGTILVPEDPFRGGSIAPYAYVPIIQPDVAGKTSLWSGNLKKYRTNNGTLYGHGNSRLYTSLTATSSGGDLIDSTADLWTDNTAIPAVGNSRVKSGGFYAQLKAPTVSDTDLTRNVYVESYVDGNENIGFKKIRVQNNQAKRLNKVTDYVYGGDTTERRRSHRKILNFMGYNIPSNTNATLDSTATEDLNLASYVPTSETRVLGSVIHSKPALVAYSADVDEYGTVSVKPSERDEYLFFGTTDGTMHLVDAQSGKEKWSLILKEMFRKQSDSLVVGNEGSLKFGVDAPWLISAKYNYEEAPGGNVSGGKVKLFEPTSVADDGTVSPDTELMDTMNYLPMAAYGGFRLGGRGLYALDLSDKNTPKVLFSITPDNITPYSTTGELSKLHFENTVDTGTTYDNVGHIWSKPAMGRIKASANDTKATDVIVFGGGYDMGYESATFNPPANPTAATRTLGSSLHIANATTGESIFNWINPENHSIVAEVTVLDRNSDGYLDHLYFADMGGNLFRADFKNSEDDEFENVNVVKIFSASATLSVDEKAEGLSHRFYSRPIVSFYKDESNQLFALINISSGDRSSPLSKVRLDKHANKVYGIIDREVAYNGLLTKFEGSYPPLITTDLDEDNLQELGPSKLADSSVTASTNSERVAKSCEPEKIGSTYKVDGKGEYVYSDECKKKVTLISSMLKATGSKNGWFYPLTRFNGYEGVSNIKSVGEQTVISSKLYMSAYDMSTTKKKANVCDAEMQGATEVQLYCLPYGVCMNDTSITGTGGFLPAGSGIQELTLGAYNQANSNVKVLIGTGSLAERESVDIGYGEDKEDKDDVPLVKVGGADATDDNWKKASQIGGDGLLPNSLETDRFILEPKQWYEVID